MTTTAPVTVTARVHVRVGRSGARSLRAGPPPAPPVGRVPRAARLMALAIKLDGLVAQGAVASQAELAEIGLVTRARVTQIMNLLSLAPDIQEELLFLPWVIEGRDPVTERDLRPIAAEIDWGRQRAMWRRIRPAGHAPQPDQLPPAH